MKCPGCDGAGWMRRQKDVSRIYGYAHSITVTKVCPVCNGERTIECYPLDSKMLAAQECAEEEEES